MGLDTWTIQAPCKNDPDAMFVQGAEQNRVKALCTGCPVKTECLAYALDARIEFGVWGGMTERERRALLKRRPDVPSWKHLLVAARAQALPVSRTHRDVRVATHSQSRRPGSPQPYPAAATAPSNR